MPIYILNRYIDHYVGCPVGENPSNHVVIRRFGDNGRAMICTQEIGLLDPNNPDDALEVYGTVFRGDSLRKLANATRFLDMSGSIAVNCRGSTLFAFVGVNLWHKTIDDTIFDWSRFGVTLGSSASASLKSQLEQMEAQNQALQKQLDKQKKSVKLVNQQYADCRKEGHDKDEELEKLHDKLSCLQLQTDEIKELRDQISSLQSQLDFTLQKLDHTLNRLKDKEDTLNYIRDELDWCRKEITDLRVELAASHTSPRQPPSTVIPLVDVSKVGAFCAGFPFPSDKFNMWALALPTAPRLGGSMKTLRVFSVVDQAVGEDDLPDKDVIRVCAVGTEFDSDNWLFVKALEYGQPTMVAIYDGDQEEVASHGSIVKVPFQLQSGAIRSNTLFFVGLLRGVGLRLMFVY